MPIQLQRTVWMFWSSGFEGAPHVVQVCVQSWKIRNPGWEIVELEDTNLAEYVDRESLERMRGLRNITVVKFSNLLRLYLLSRYGGVWADSTCYCCKPLDQWLHHYMESGFFAFRRHPDTWLKDPRNGGLLGLFRRSGDRIVSSWFLAATKGNLLPTLFFERHLEFFSANRFSLRGTPKGIARRKVLSIVLQRNARLCQLWAHPLVARVMKIYPYFIIHYHFAKLISEDPRCAAIWRTTPEFFAAEVTRLLRLLVSPVDDVMLPYVVGAAAPVQKLTWKYRHEDFKEGCVLDLLQRSIN